MPFDKVLIANRGEIARRIMRTCRAMGLSTVAVYSDADRHAAHVAEADEAVHIGPPASADSYLVIERILEAAARTGAGAIHPGYGFLSENAAFAKACDDAGVVFVGPTADAIEKMGSKVEAKRLMRDHGVPVIPGHAPEDQSPETLRAKALDVGFPVLLKASAGGGGKGMRVVHEEAGLDAAIAAARREAESAFGDGTLLIEKYVERPRHVEFQILGDAHGTVLHVFERECSIQRRHQKIIEETPSPVLTPELRARMADAAVKAGEALGYRSAGTVEFIVAPDGSFYFLEVNTRLQVEHPVTEMTTGLDLVRLQLLVASGEPLPIAQDDIVQRGHSIECRIYAEDPANDFLPATGRLHDWHFDDVEGLRVDSAVRAGDEVSIYYDPMLAKVVTWAPTRVEANRRMVRALERASIQGVTTNRDFLVRILRHPAWQAGEIDTHFIDHHFRGNAARTPVADPTRDRLAAVAASLRRVEARRAERPTLPGLPLSFRNNRWRPVEETWRVGDDEIAVGWRPVGGQAGGFEVTLGDDTHAVTDLAFPDDATVRFAVDGHVQSFRVVDRGERVWVHGSRGSTALVELPRFPDAAGAELAGAAVAPMPGKVLQVLVEAGQPVEAGQALVIVEAMKMEHTVAAAEDGEVEEVLVGEGDLVDADQPLVRMVE